MEKVKVSGPMHPGRYHYEFYEWRLTTEEKNGIRHILNGVAPEEKIESFLHYLQGLCMLKKMLLEQPARSKVRKARGNILTDCKAALGHLKRCEKGQPVTWYDETIDPFWSYRPEQRKVCLKCKHPFTTSGQRAKCVQCDPMPPKEAPDDYESERNFLVRILDSSWAAVGPLEKFIEVLEKYHTAENRKTGRRAADSDHFIRKIREIFTEHIGKPTKYTEGPFYNVVRTVLGMFGPRSEYPDRAIKAALK
jgi:hypothetical protein